MTKIDIISGFLGAGKTTFIKKMLDEGNLSYYKEKSTERGKQFNAESTTLMAEKTIEGVLE